MGRGRGQNVQARTSGTQGRVYAVTPQTEVADSSMIQGTFLIFLLWASVTPQNQGVSLTTCQPAEYS